MANSKRKYKPHPKKKDTNLEHADKKRFIQLMICLLISAFVFMGKGNTDGVLYPVVSRVNDLVHETTDFRAAFSQAGQSLSEGEPFVQTFGVLISGVFGAEEESDTQEDVKNDIVEPVEEQQTEKIPEALPEDSQEEDLQEMSQTGTVEYTVPVIGVVSSGFGERIHPIDGEWKQHNGVDIVAEEKTPILAFASGEVDYIGKSPVYGNYIQLKHADGMCTFYAHCNQLLARRGDKVEQGEVIATVGQTGGATGTHLHFEVKEDGVRVDPQLYLDRVKS